MIKALFYKEWIKTNKVVWLLIFLFGGCITYSFIRLAQMLRIYGAVETWNSILLKDIIMISEIEYLPLLAGLLMALSQYIPEMTDKRLKLTLHLPRGENQIMLSLLAYGSTVLISLFTASCLIFLVGLRYYFAQEIVMLNLWASLPWFVGGFMAYLLFSWICLEPTWKQRTFNSLISITFLSLFYIDGKQGSYFPFILYAIALVILCISFPFYSAERFKEGAQ